MWFFKKLELFLLNFFFLCFERFDVLILKLNFKNKKYNFNALPAKKHFKKQ